MAVKTQSGGEMEQKRITGGEFKVVHVIPVRIGQLWKDMAVKYGITSLPNTVQLL